MGQASSVHAAEHLALPGEGLHLCQCSPWCLKLWEQLTLATMLAYKTQTELLDPGWPGLAIKTKPRKKHKGKNRHLHSPPSSLFLSPECGMDRTPTQARYDSFYVCLKQSEQTGGFRGQGTVLDSVSRMLWCVNAVLVQSKQKRSKSEEYWEVCHVRDCERVRLHSTCGSASLHLDMATVAPLARQRTCKPGRTRFPLPSTFPPRLLLQESRPSLLPSWGGKTRVQTAANAEFRRSLLAGHWLYRAKWKTSGGGGG